MSSTATAVNPSLLKSSDSPRPFGYRKDIQGLRAVAVGVVLLYHAKAPFIPGGFIGVDVFFVISGFLITGLLLKEAADTGKISLTGFYARRAKRILPAATIVLLVTALLTYTILPRTRWEDTATQVFAAAFNALNWLLAGSAVDYLAGDDAASPVQHFWTLAVEEQFYIVWPLLIVASLLVARRRGSTSELTGRRQGINPRLRTALIRLAVLLLTVPSLAWSIYYTVAEPGSAYFVTTTRAWELGIGAAVAVFAQALCRIAKAAADILSWAGFAAILAAAFLYTADTPFPGYAALLPTLGAAAVIVGGMQGASRGVGALLSSGPFIWVGGISYSLYLWHWPLIVVATYLLDGLEFYQGAIVIALSFLPAYLSYRFVEEPILRSDRLKESNALSLQIGSILIAVAAIAAVMILLIPKPVSTAGFVSQEPLADPLANTAVEPVIGAALLAANRDVGRVVDKVESFHPAALDAADDNPVVYKLGCHQNASGVEATSCVFGNDKSDFTIALVGDSHAAQWVPALVKVAQKNDWRMVSYTKSACPLTTATMPAEKGGVYQECTDWNNATLGILTGPQRPDFVLVSSSAYNAATSEASSVQGLVGAWSALRTAGVPFAVLADTPRAGINVPECVSANPEKLSKCAVERTVTERNGYPDQLEAAGVLGDVSIVNMNDLICPEATCPAIVGNVLVYRDSNHLTATYSSSLATGLEQKLRALKLPFAPVPGGGKK